MKIIKYDPENYSFKELVSSVFDISDLDLIHKKKGTFFPLKNFVLKMKARQKFLKVFIKK